MADIVNISATRRQRLAASALARPRRRSVPRWEKALIGVLAALVIAGFASVVLDLEMAFDGVLVGRAEAVVVDQRFAPCVGTGQISCVIDGDTFRHERTTIRIADIDTPEIFSHQCPAEKALGERATRRLVALLNDGPFAVEDYGRDEDQYGRKLRVITRDGQSLGMMLVAEGLARPWGGARRGWC